MTLLKSTRVFAVVTLLFPSLVVAQATNALCTVDSDVLRNSTLLQQAVALLEPTMTCGQADATSDGSDYDRDNCTFDYGTARGNSDEYESVCLDEGGHFYRYDAIVACVPDGNNQTTDREESYKYPNCVAPSCTSLSDATDYFTSTYDATCTVEVTIVEGPLSKTPKTNATSNKGNGTSTSRANCIPMCMTASLAASLLVALLFS